MTNAELVRLEAGDTGTPTRDVADGDGLATEFYLSSPPILALSEVVRVGATTKVRDTDYTIDLSSGKLLFTSPPTSGDENIIVTYKAVQLSDAEVTEANGQAGLTATGTAVAGDLRILSAAVICCDWLAARYATDYDVDADGQSMKRSQMAAAYERRAENLRLRLAKTRGLTSTPLQRIDGYNDTEVTSRDIGTTQTNPRRRYYGEPDRIP